MHLFKYTVALQLFTYVLLALVSILSTKIILSALINSTYLCHVTQVLRKDNMYFLTVSNVESPNGLLLVFSPNVQWSAVQNVVFVLNVRAPHYTYVSGPCFVHWSTALYFPRPPKNRVFKL